VTKTQTPLVILLCVHLVVQLVVQQQQLYNYRSNGARI